VSPFRLRIEPPAGTATERECSNGTLTFGRGADCDVVITDHSMSRHHARITEAGGAWTVEDLGARNGTFVNGERISAPRQLTPGDTIKMGATLVRLTSSEPSARELGVGNLGSSIFRSVSDINSEIDATAAAPTKVAARLKAINDFHRALAGPISLDALLSELLDRLFATLHPEEGIILLRQPDGSLTPAASRRLPNATAELLVSRRLIGEVVDKGTAALVSDIEFDDRFSGSDSIVGSGIRSILAAPMSDAAGCVGMVAVYSRAHVRRFGEEDLELLVSLASAAALRIRNVALSEGAAARRVQDHELALAHDIQMAMLPRHVEGLPELELAGTLLPARAVGGDLYDFFGDGDRFWFIVADAAGKGVSAALFMAITRTLFRAVALGETPVATVVGRMNAELARDNERQFFVTAVVGCLHLPSGALTFVSAGHPPPIIAAANRPPQALGAEASGIAMGIIGDAVYAETHVTLAPDDVLLLVTDGITEAINPAGELFTEDRVVSGFAASVDRPARGIITSLVDAVNAFAGGAPQEDDITALALRYRGR
jgi:phosphoserine phosphatase RsbU/P